MGLGFRFYIYIYTYTYTYIYIYISLNSINGWVQRGSYHDTSCYIHICMSIYIYIRRFSGSDFHGCEFKV